MNIDFKLTEIYSSNKILKYIKKEEKVKINENKKQIKFYLKNTFKNTKNLKDEFEDEIIFMINNSISLNFISNYFGLNKKYIEEIAKKNQLSSKLIKSYNENIEARCFTKNQILKTCEEFNYICPMCFKSLDITNFQTLTGHHIIPFAKGGKTSKDNCLPLHISCHFSDFKLLHSALFDSEDPIYSAKYFNELKNKFQKEESGITLILKKYINNSEKNK